MAVVENDKAKRVRKRTLLKGLLSVEVLNRHPDAKPDPELNFDLSATNFSV